MCASTTTRKRRLASDAGQGASEYAVATAVVMLVAVAVASLIAGLRDGSILDIATKSASHAVGSLEGVVGFVLDVFLY